ncbi:hypothetical protein [Streptomyces sp. RK75]|uniref:hypothetical protein n=1 Tax=Streptomyces sp. RK75 TaxID=2824895 RepID=UPI00161FB47A|nr:hypothetical protein [Streptomyces sp. RK75]MBQ0866781.1 hypothetical protein [Streptomyces sp. RK75]
MQRDLRSIAMGAVLVLGLAGCSEASDADDSGKGGLGDGDAMVVRLSPSQLSQALPSKLSAPKGWEGEQREVVQGSEAWEQCEQQGDLTCSGLTSLGTTRFEKPYPSKASMKFTLLAYDTEDNAKVGMKELVTAEHEDAGDKLKPRTVKAGADDTDAFDETYHSTAILRVGTVVAFLPGKHLPQADHLRTFAKLQVDRVKIASAGKNPDA